MWMADVDFPTALAPSMTTAPKVSIAFLMATSANLFLYFFTLPV